MNKIATALLFALGANAAERYIIHYTDAAWNSLHASSLPDNTVSVLRYVQMVVADLSTDELAIYQNIPGLEVFPDQDAMFDTHSPVTPSGKVQENPSNWGIDRIDQRDLPLDKKFHYENEGEGVDIYIVDTGVLKNHVEFTGRVTFHKNFSNQPGEDDCNGHGTHVASSAAGNTVGIARKANIHAVRTGKCNGYTRHSWLIAGIDYVTGTQVKNPNQKSVMNMSFSSDANDIMRRAVLAAHKAGVVAVAAAGNNKGDACLKSPADLEEVITVAATDKNDKQAVFSSYGKCVDIYAPGDDINGASHKGNEAYKLNSGTSMATPHVTGVVAVILSSGLAKTPAEVKAKLVEASTKDHVQSAGPNTPNRLLYADPTWGHKSVKKFSLFDFESLNNL